MLTLCAFFRFLFDKIFREDKSFKLGDTAICGAQKVGEHHRDVELKSAWKLTSGLHSIAREDKLANFSTEDNSKHCFLDEGARAADVWTGGDDHFALVARINFNGVLLPLWDVDVAMLHTGEILTENE